jgi:signal-transduction protein with cAMP-binding, CBS, and nucleotidyltransferase domain
MIESTELQKIPFFSDFHLEDLDTILNYIEIVNVKSGDFIIEQNSLNLAMYFLVSGEVEIIIDDKVITSYKDNPVTLGEVSFVNNDLASASVKAKADSTLISLSINQLNKLNNPSYYRLRMSAFKACASILAHKLNLTNALAKTYE